jgi:hypothetical protein
MPIRHRLALQGSCRIKDHRPARGRKSVQDVNENYSMGAFKKSKKV